MADPWLEHDASRTAIDEASGVVGRDVAEGCRDGSALATTGFVQPALLALDVAAFRVWRRDSGCGRRSLAQQAGLVAAGVSSSRRAQIV
jgi:hypothetical protein